jgi:hypothetical protein
VKFLTLINLNKPSPLQAVAFKIITFIQGFSITARQSNAEPEKSGGTKTVAPYLVTVFAHLIGATLTGAMP